jgi:hypothetical protein
MGDLCWSQIALEALRIEGALKTTTGASLWSYSTADETQSSSTVVNGMVFIGTPGDQVYTVRLPA